MHLYNVMLCWINLSQSQSVSLMIYRDTTVATTGYSTAQLLLVHHIRTNLPALPSVLKPRVPDPEQVRDNDHAAKLGYEHHYNRKHGVRPLSELSPGDTVHMKLDNQDGWHSTGVVQSDGGTPRSYLVEGDNGHLYRRNPWHLRPYTPTPQPELAAP